MPQILRTRFDNSTTITAHNEGRVVAQVGGELMDTITDRNINHVMLRSDHVSTDSGVYGGIAM